MLLSALSGGHLRSNAPPTAADGTHARLVTADSKRAAPEWTGCGVGERNAPSSNCICVERIFVAFQSASKSLSLYIDCGERSIDARNT